MPRSTGLYRYRRNAVPAPNPPTLTNESSTAGDSAGTPNSANSTNTSPTTVEVTAEVNPQGDNAPTTQDLRSDAEQR